MTDSGRELLCCCCCCSVAKSCNPTDCSMLHFPVLHYLPEFGQIHVHWVSDAIQISHPLPPLLLLPSTFPASVFSSELALHIKWPKYWWFSISPSNEYSGWVSFRIDWLDLLLSRGFSRVFSSSTVWKHQFFGAQPSFWSNSHMGH